MGHGTHHRQERRGPDLPRPRRADHPAAGPPGTPPDAAPRERSSLRWSVPPEPDHPLACARVNAATLAVTAAAAFLGIGALAIRKARRERAAERALQHAYDTLEERVRQRTAQLQDANARLEAAVADREALLKEVQHRVKNNLQVICSLLRLQSSRLDEHTRQGFDESLRRIQSMSLLHELLYRSGRAGRLDFAEYLRALCDHLVRAGGPTAVRVSVDGPPWEIEVDQVMPLVLIASELIANALHHAFPRNRAGEVVVALEPAAGGMRFTVRDNGVGLPPEQPFPGDRRQRGLGLVLVQALVQQVGGTVRVDREDGTAFVLTVPPPAARQRKGKAPDGEGG